MRSSTILLTILQKIRKMLNLQAFGPPLDLAYLKSLDETLNEWGSKNDEEDYRDL